MTLTTLSTFLVDDATVRYLQDSTGQVGLEIIPTALLSSVVTRRENLTGTPEIDLIPGDWIPPAYALDPLVHLKILGDAYTGGFAQGRTMRNAPSNGRFRYEKQDVEREDAATTVVTLLISDEDYRLEHRLSWRDGDRAVEIATRFVNGGKQPVTLEMLTSFSLGGITPFDAADAPERLRAHRFRSIWSGEGRLDTQTLEQLHLTPTWSGHANLSERFGTLGSMPVRGWFPFAAIEDVQTGVVWGAQLAWAGSWQMELFRQRDTASISGGLADREFGHWTKTIAPGETFATPPATLAVVHGDLDALCDRLTATRHRAADRHPEVEQELPIVFNEWCTTWGNPTHDRLVGIAKRLRGSEVQYLVIDAGWYKGDVGEWGSAHGDWVPSRTLFPEGLEATAAAIREHGLIPGLWFEMETCGPTSVAFSLTDHLLKRDGIPITTNGRRFWDLTDRVAWEYLTERVIDLLDRCGFGYLKVDYNETIGLGCDGAESQGEGLRRHIDGVHSFFERIRERLPDLVIENCSSGGHRLEPSMIGRTAMSSFSDAHETAEIPIVAANLHRLMLPRQSQIWAVLHASDTDKRLVYSLAATFLGRMCLSGDVDLLDARQWTIVRQAEQLYRAAAPTIKYGSSRRTGTLGESWRHPHGWQAVTRISDDGLSVLVVAHAFAVAPAEFQVELPDASGWAIQGQLHSGTESVVDGDGRTLTVRTDGDFSGVIVVLGRG